MPYLFGDQLIWIVAAFAVAIWLAGKVVMGRDPSWVMIVAGALVFAIFMTDFALLLAQDVIIGVGILAFIVLLTQGIFKVNFVNSAVVVVFAWIVGTILIGAVQGSLNIFNPWF